MLQFALECLFLYLICLTLWKRFQRYTKSELEIIPGPRSQSFLKGVFPKVFNANGWDYHRHLWETYGRVIRFKGLFGENMLYTYDPKALHHILVKDQDVFEQTPSVIVGTRLLFGPGLLGTLGDYHRKQRKLLNPVFSIAHMRQMMPIFYRITHKLEASILKQVQPGPKEIDMLSWMGRTALELIGQCGFGHSFDDLTEGYNEHSYSSAIKKVVPVTFRMVFFRVHGLHHVVKIGSDAFRRKLIDILPWPAMKEARDIADALHKTSLDIYQAKKRAILEGNQEVMDHISHGKDILSILMKANMEASDEDRLPEEEIYGQIATFTFAGMDTTSNAIARILWLLAQHTDIQDKLRRELKQAIDNFGREIPYDNLVALPYLDAICRETMRLYAPAWQLLRKPTKDIFLPLSSPIKTVGSTEINEILVPKGTTVMCGLLASNRNTEIWGLDALEWKPERWIEGLPKAVADAHLPGVYSHLMTFSGGSRACIGFKFSQLEMKTVLAVLIPRFEFSPSQEIIWRMTNIVTPALAHGDHQKPQMPLMVKLAA
ncbi:cytochrome P450 [Panaeolus papilionaceus]|nr:cytochrome P450 [Panaeolus papilionaceus]